MVRMVDEARHRQEDFQKIIPAQVHGLKDRNRPIGIANGTDHVIRAVKGRRASVQNISEKMDDHDDSHLLQLYDGGENKHQVVDNSPRKTTVRTRGALKQNDELEGFETNERRTKREYSNGVTQVPLREGDDIMQFSSEGNSEHDFLHDNESWSESQSEEDRAYDDEGNLRHKRRTLGELESTNNLIRISNEDFMGKRRVRHMRSVMSEGGKETRMKGSRETRERRVPVHKGKESLDKSDSRRRTWAESMSWHGKQQLGRHVYDAEDGLTENLDKADMPEFNRLQGIDLQRPREDGSSVPNERRGLRVSRRARRDITRRDISGDRYQGRLSEVTAASRDKGIRTRKSSAWLLQSEAEEGTRYIPQFDDEVVYLRQGHQEFLESCKVDEPGPWTIFKNSIRAVEICRVAQLDYAILANSGDSCCNLTLEFTDCTTHLQGKTFRLSLPELTDFPDFLVEKSRYDAAIERNWTHRDRCKVWWRSADGQGGEWWEGRVIAVKPKSSDFPDSPWDRFLVQYKTDTSKPLSHSPWELFDPKNGKWEAPHTDEEQRAHFLSMLESATNRPEDAYGLHRLKQLACRSDFINRVYLPLTLDIIKQRLENDYYRSIQAFYFDVRLLISNAESYYGSNSMMADKMQRFSRYLLEEFSSCDFPV